MSDIDVNKLRKDLTDYYGTAAFSGFPMAIMDTARMSSASKEDLIREAAKNGFDLNKYKTNKW